MRKNKRVASCELRVASESDAQTRKSYHSPLTTHHQPRRGILLLVVLSMLTLFLLIGTVYIVSANHYRQTNKTLAKLTETSNSSIDQGDLLNEVINQLVRDTNNQNSTLRFHSLLRDMYGNDGILGEINIVEWAGGGTAIGGGITAGQMLEFTLNSVANQFGDQLPLTTLSPINNAYNGLVMTFLDGPARGQSTRITSYVPSSGTFPALFRVMAPRLADGKTISDPSTLSSTLTLSRRILINGRPFNGTGVGYNRFDPAPFDTNTARLTAGEALRGSADPNDPNTYFSVALMPNAAFFNPRHLRPKDYLEVPSKFFIFPGATQQEVWDNLPTINSNYQRLLEQYHYAGLGGSDESYDAVDYQNMLLALLPTNPSETRLPGQPGSWPDTSPVLPDWPISLPADLGNMVLPSLHRPALINYWRNQTVLHTEPNLLRKVMLRPNWFDHRNFTGSNPDLATTLSDFNAALDLAGATPLNPVAPDVERVSKQLVIRTIYGPWDVDNDNDGVRDSVWVDFGAPVMENSDGRLVKPLAAILVLDMDGRLNLNAHGSEDIANPTNFGVPIAGTGNTTNILPQGQGFGPAEISLAPLMPGTTPANRWRWYKRFFQGAEPGASFNAIDGSNNDAFPTASIDARKFRRRTVGKFGQRPDPTDRLSRPLPGIDNTTVFDILGQLKMQGVPRWADGSILETSKTANPILGGYATPPDFRGRYALGINDFGQPVYEALSTFELGAFGSTQDTNTPYELDLSLGAARGDSKSAPDGPYTMAELERILRAYDADAGTLPSRIWEMAGEFKDNSANTTPNLDKLNLWRTTVTTDTYDLPVPSAVAPDWMRLGPNGLVGGIGLAPNDDFEKVMGRPPVSLSFADMLEYRIRVAYIGHPRLRQSDLTPAILQRDLRKLLPHDLADGLRLDINRPIGNGRDDNGNGVVDEPGEWNDVNNDGIIDDDELHAFWASSDMRLDAFTDADATGPGDPYNFTGLYRDDSLFLRDLGSDVNNDGIINALDDLPALRLSRGVDGAIDTLAERVSVDNLRRQMLARDLYVLATTLIDPLPIEATIDDRRARARRLAQWAINVVDFRDPDNVMTAFEYDANPFDGWSPDGNLATRNDIYGADNNVGSDDDQGGLVWGSERPELLITETLGWHDRATENTNKEDPANDEDGDGFVNDDDQGTVPLLASETAKLPDTDYDQRLRPKGAAFVELYCPWPENPASNADLHAIDNAGNDLGVNLAAVAVDTTGIRTTDSPVWRLMMYKDGGPGMDPDYFDDDLRPRHPDRSVYFAGFDPQYPDQPGLHTVREARERYVDDGVAFFNNYDERTGAGNIDNRVLPVRPGGYMVVGAGEDSGAGSYVSKLSSPTTTVSYTLQGIKLDVSQVPNTISVQDASGARIKDPAGFDVVAEAGIAIINRAGPTSEQRRFTFSEPALGYPDRVEGSLWNGTSYVPTVDIPLDDQRAIFERGRGFTGRPNGNGGSLQARRESELNDGEIKLSLPGFRQGRGFDRNIRPAGALGRDIEQASRTIPGFKHVYLQRLANPTLPWNPEPFLPNGTDTPGYDARLAVNPYLTIDSMGANVTVYTGLSQEERRVDLTNPRDPILRFRNRIPIDSMASVQRGRDNDPAKPADPASLKRLQDRLAQRPDNDILGLLKSPKKPVVTMNLWNPEPIGYIDGTVAGFWKNQAGSSANGVSGTTQNFNGIPDCTLGFLNEPFHEAGPFPPGTQADDLKPESPFPWFTWNNRPFANSGELLHVPAFPSSQLLGAFSMRDDDTAQAPTATAKGTDERYDGKLPERKLADDGIFGAELFKLATDGAFGHLLNFFRTKRYDPSGDSDPAIPSSLTDDQGMVGLNRVLDYVHVPSPFVATETWMNPATFGNANVTNVDDPRYQRQPPFNRISSYREPGRINLNTIVSPDVWEGGVLHRELIDPSKAFGEPLTALLGNPATGLFTVEETRSNLFPPHGINLYVESWPRNHFQAESATNPRVYGHSGPNAVELTDSRRGYGIANSSGLLLNADNPTFFANPFRSADAGELVPLPGMLREGVHGTMLRGAQAPPPAPAGALQPLFPGETTDDPSTAAPDIENSFQDSNRNSYFRYQPISRLSSMTTTRSNVYAVWVTIGFFEVQEAPDKNTFRSLNDPTNVFSQAQLDALYERVYPEGFQFGQEAGSDTGDIRRVREFAIIDRTVPVAFEPGHNHNVDKAVRLRRRIE